MSSIAAAWKRLPWWVEPVSVVIVLSVLVLLVPHRASFLPGEYKDYLSPFYSPPIPHPDWMPDFITAPMFIIWMPLGFRATCYYYRKAYYRAFFWDPPACQAGAQEGAAQGRELQGEGRVRAQQRPQILFYASFVVLASCGTTRFLRFFRKVRSG